MGLTQDLNISTTTQAIELGDVFPITVSSTDSLPDPTDVIGVYANNAFREVQVFDAIQEGVSMSGDTALTVQTVPLDTGYWALQGLVLADSSQLQAVQPRFVHVGLMEVDTTESIKDIHAPVDGEFNILHYWPEGLGVLLVIAAVVAAAVFFRKRQDSDVPEEHVPSIDPTQRAFDRLNHVKQSQLAVSGTPKEFFSEVTAIVREYIESGLSIPALEQTSAELLHSVRYHAAFQERTFVQLQNLCQVSDAVKFAKHITSVDVNEQQLQHAYSIVVALSEYLNQQEQPKEVADA